MTGSAANRPRVNGTVPAGVVLRRLEPHGDERGVFVEHYRREWGEIGELEQWSFSHSVAGTVRGVHVHPRHDDWMVLVSGRMFAGLHDLRPSSFSCGASACVEVDADAPAAIMIPHGVAHGFWFPEPSAFVLGVTHTYDPADELGCRWDDPELGIAWPEITGEVTISQRDAELQPVAELRRELAELEHFF